MTFFSRQFICSDLGSHYSLTVMIIHIHWSGTCGLFIGWCWLRFMASYCSCTIPNGEKDYLVSLSDMQIVTVVSYQLHDCLILGFFIFFFFFPCSKTCILQLYCYHVLDECSCFISLCTYWKWGWFWVLVIFIQSPSNK